MILSEYIMKILTQTIGMYYYIKNLKYITIK